MGINQREHMGIQVALAKIISRVDYPPRWDNPLGVYLALITFDDSARWVGSMTLGLTWGDQDAITPGWGRYRQVTDR